jgi:hypothetical protein
MPHYKWNLENNINHLQYYKCNLENAYKFFFVLILELKYFANDKCMDLIAHASLPTLFQNKFWCIIGIKSNCKMQITFQAFHGNNYICYKTPDA